MAALAIPAMAQAGLANWDVATVHGYDQFTIGPGGTSLLYDQQPRNTEGWYWNQNNGSPAGTLATGGFGPNGWRDGSRTFAATDVAYGQTLSNLKLQFEYHNTLGDYPTINFFVTDGSGHYGIFAPTSLGIGAVGVIDKLNGWSRMTIDLTLSSIPLSTGVAIYEHNGLSANYESPFTTFQWGDIKNLTIAGMYDYQRSPAGGWDAWGTSFDATHGLALIWGDTVGNDPYTQQEREIRDLVVSFGGVDHSGTFAPAQVPEPTTLLAGGLLLIPFGMSTLRRFRRNRQA